MNVAVPLAIGFVFGAALQLGGLTRYARIAGVFRFADLTVIKFLLTALVVGSAGVALLRGTGLSPHAAVSTTYVWGNVLGGVILGAGMSLSGYCPGTIVAGAGEGRIDNVIGFAGIVSGALAFGWLYPRLAPALNGHANWGQPTLDRMLGVHPILLVLLLVEVYALIVYRIERPGRPRQIGKHAQT